MGEPAPFSRTGENPFLLLLVLMQRIIKTGDHPRGVAEGGVLGDVLDALAVNPDFAAVIEAVEEFLAGVRQERRSGALGSCHCKSSLERRLIAAASKFNVICHSDYAAPQRTIAQTCWLDLDGPPLFRRRCAGPAPPSLP